MKGLFCVFVAVFSFAASKQASPQFRGYADSAVAWTMSKVMPVA